MTYPEDECARCGEAQIMHITIKDTEGEIRYICQTAEFRQVDKTRYMTKREREFLEKSNNEQR